MLAWAMGAGKPEFPGMAKDGSREGVWFYNRALAEKKGASPPPKLNGFTNKKHSPL